MNLAQISNQTISALYSAVSEKHSVSNLEQVGVSQRLINLLQSNGINSIEELLNKKREDLMGFQNFGAKQMDILITAISKYHLVDDQ